MNSIRKVFDLYINSSIHVSIAILSFTILTFFEHHLALDKNFLGFIFFAGITGYNFVKFSGIAQLHHATLTRNLRLIQLFSLFCFIAMIYFAWHLALRTWIAGGVLGILTGLYAVPVSGKTLRNLSGMKIFVIALVWAGSTVLLPLIEADKILDMDSLVDFIQRLMLALALTLPFEIRDLKFDHEELGTIPQQIGLRETKVFGTVLFLIIFIIELFQKEFNSAYFIATALTCLLGAFFLWNSRLDQKKYYASFWVEAAPIFYLGVFLMLKYYS